MVFSHDDDYSFGIKSGIHWVWFTNRCSTLTERFRYTSNTVFDSFPWPQEPSVKDIKAVAAEAVAFRKKRNESQGQSITCHCVAYIVPWTCAFGDWRLLGCRKENGTPCAASDEPEQRKRAEISIEIYHLQHEPICKDETYGSCTIVE
jgi:hypothetical protein